MKRFFTSLLMAGATAVATPGQVSDAGQPTLTPEQHREREEQEAVREQRQREAHVARHAQLTSVPTPEMMKTPTRFQFGGGFLSDFIEAIQEQFGVDLRKVGTVPDSMLHTIRVPKMRMGDGEAGLSYRSVLFLYNQVSEDPNVAMGRWIMKGGTVHPDVLMLVPSRGPEESSFRVKAFSFPSKGAEAEKSLERVRQLVREEQMHLDALVQMGTHPGISEADIRGELKHHREAGILVATGGRVFVELASAIIEAAKEQWRNMPIDIPIPTNPGNDKIE